MIGLSWIEILIIAGVGILLVGGIVVGAVLVGLAALPKREDRP